MEKFIRIGRTVVNLEQVTHANYFPEAEYSPEQTVFYFAVTDEMGNSKKLTFRDEEAKVAARAIHLLV